MNLTDVDDKTIKGAISKKQSLDTYTKKFKEKTTMSNLKRINLDDKGFDSIFKPYLKMELNKRKISDDP